MPAVSIEVGDAPVGFLVLPDGALVAVVVVADHAAGRTSPHGDGEVSESPGLVLGVLVEGGGEHDVDGRTVVRDGDGHESLLVVEVLVVVPTLLRSVVEREVLAVHLGSVDEEQELLVVPGVDLEQGERHGDLVVRVQVLLQNSRGTLPEHIVPSEDLRAATLRDEVLVLLRTRDCPACDFRGGDGRLSKCLVHWLLRVDRGVHDIREDLELPDSPRFVVSGLVNRGHELKSHLVQIVRHLHLRVSELVRPCGRPTEASCDPFIVLEVPAPCFDSVQFQA